jgi:PAS domain S-box-containing protein
MIDDDTDNIEQLKKKLGELEDRYQTVLHRYKQATIAARVGVWSWNLHSGDFYIDPSLKTILGYSNGEIPDRLESWVELIHPDDRGPLETAAKALISGRQRDDAFEHRMRHKDGSSHWFVVKASVELDSRGRPVSLLGTSTEITQRKHLEMSIQEAVSEENARISLNLHDGLGQELAGISFLISSLENRLRSNQSALASDAANIRKALSDAIGHTREIARGLYPVPVGPVGIVSALRKLAEGTSRVFKVNCQLIDYPDNPPDLRPSQANQIYFIAQEAINNAVRHGLAKQISMSCQALEHEFRLSISDQGRGMSPDNSSPEGMGLRIMVYRARNLGGDLTVQTNPGGGTTINCRIPLSMDQGLNA